MFSYGQGPGKCGLSNLGNTCYINAILTFLAYSDHFYQVEGLTKKFLQENEKTRTKIIFASIKI